MARVTVEDCIDKVENRFELVLLASHRARQISQAKAQELVGKALAGLDGVSQEGMDALASLGQWAAAGGR